MKTHLLGAAGCAAALAGLALAINSAGDSPLPPRSPVTRQAFAADPRMDALLHRACADCHSAETRWPWYAESKLIGNILQHDVDRGREKLDFSTRAPLGPNEKQEILDASSDRSMPPPLYVLLHPRARLSAADLAAIRSWAAH